MGPDRIARYIGRDLWNFRHGGEVLAGIATIAVAFFITSLALSFSDTAKQMVNKAIEPTRPVAGVVILKPAGAMFTTAATDEVRSRLAAARKTGEVQAVAYRTTSIDYHDLPLADHRDQELELTDSGPFHVWCVPYDSPLIRPEFGFKVQGNVFTRKDRPRFGALVNITYLEPYMGLNAQEAAERFHERPETLPRQIRLRFPPLPNPDGYVPIAIPPCHLTMTGYFDNPSYPPLVLTEDVAAAYYSQARGSDGKVSGGFPLKMPFHFYGQESDAPLVDPGSLNLGPAIVGSFPDKDDLLAFPLLTAEGLTPYDEAAVYLRDWKEAGTRERFRDLLMEPIELGTVEGALGRSLADALISQDRKDISELITKATELDLSAKIMVHPVAPDSGFTHRFEVSESATGLRLRARVKGAAVDLHRHPEYRAVVRQVTLTNSLIRVRSIVNFYAWTVVIFVAVFAFFATVLLALCHVLRKSRDIGLLFVNGAGKCTVFTILVGEVMSFGLAGVIIGLPFFLGLRRWIEGKAIHDLRSFTPGVDQVVPEYTTLLGVNWWLVIGAGLIVMVATFIGAAIAAIGATLKAPLTSLNGGT